MADSNFLANIKKKSIAARSYRTKKIKLSGSNILCTIKKKPLGIPEPDTIKIKPDPIPTVLDEEAFTEPESLEEEDDDTWINVSDDEDMDIWSDDYTEDED